MVRLTVARQIDQLPLRCGLQKSSTSPLALTKAAGSRSCDSAGPGGSARIALQSIAMGFRLALTRYTIRQRRCPERSGRFGSRPENPQAVAPYRSE